ncbi:MAG: Coenzyme F420 hydrogenase/dehydrogenase, beta subunit C-terminal domain [Marvinbryantia sp.]|jgi:coenzyme F420-reducing hydrogenase beta subunit
MMITTVYEKKDKCCGCSACTMVCPKQCIKMQPDEEGFLYPQIDKELCVNCSLCQKVCPVLKKSEMENDPDCYIAFSENQNIRKNSSSGGMFTELAKKQIEKGALVYGAGFDENFEVTHKAVSLETHLGELRGSKYVQSRMNDKYREIKEELDRGESIYFSGTPCQVAGLYSYLGHRPEKLTTQDFICHGVPSPLVWKKYLSTFGNVKKVEFRNKKYGWHYFALHIESDKRDYYKRLDEDFYLKLFLDNIILRPICYDCPIKKQGSSADITLADCWSLNHMTDKMTDADKGLSLVIANTSKGKSCLKKVKDSGEIVAIPVDAKKALNSQSVLRKSAYYNPRREQFFERFKQEEFSMIIKNWYIETFKEKLHKKYIYLKTKIRFVLKIK